MTYDAIIIGAGQAGGPLAYALADKGWTVAFVERGPLGGTCVNTGCTPTKTMVASAQVAHYAREAARWGVNAGPVSIDLPAILKRKEKVVRSSRSGHERKVAERPNVTSFRGEARFESPTTVRVGETLLEGKRIFINTGARPSVPDIAGLEEAGYLTNESLMELTEVPASLLVLGGGYIGLEFAQMFRRFGSEVTVVHHGDQILPHEDPDIAAELQKALEAEGLRIILDAETRRVERGPDGVTLHLGDQSVTAAALLVATGRVPNTEALNLEAAGVQTDAHGFIRVNDRLETNVAGIWAMGDVKGGPAFTHISYNDYQIVYANVAEGASQSIKDRIVPYAVFTDPQLGRVGMTEEEARATGRPLKIGSIPMSWVARAIERDETAGMMKLVVDAETDRILGAAILGVEGGEIVHVIHTLMLADQPYTLLKGAVYIHPTLAEGFWTLFDSVKPT